MNGLENKDIFGTYIYGLVYYGGLTCAGFENRDPNCVGVTLGNY